MYKRQKYSTLRTVQYVQRFVLINAKGRQMVFGTAVTNPVAMTPEVLARIPGYDEEYSGWSCICLLYTSAMRP